MKNRSIFVKFMSASLALITAFSCVSQFSCKNSDKKEEEKTDDQQQEQEVVNKYENYALPVIEINTENGNIKSKVVAQKCTVNALNTTEENTLDGQGASVKGYDSAVWRLPKRPMK